MAAGDPGETEALHALATASREMEFALPGPGPLRTWGEGDAWFASASVRLSRGRILAHLLILAVLVAGAAFFTFAYTISGVGHVPWARVWLGGLFAVLPAVGII